MFQRAGHLAGVAKCLIQAGVTFRITDQPKRAEGVLSANLPFIRRHGDRRDVALALMHLGLSRAESSAGVSGDAELAASVTRFTELASAPDLGRAILGQAWAAVLRGRADQARTALAPVIPSSLAYPEQFQFYHLQLLVELASSQRGKRNLASSSVREALWNAIDVLPHLLASNIQEGLHLGYLGILSAFVSSAVDILSVTQESSLLVALSAATKGILSNLPTADESRRFDGRSLADERDRLGPSLLRTISPLDPITKERLNGYFQAYANSAKRVCAAIPVDNSRTSLTTLQAAIPQDTVILDMWWPDFTRWPMAVIIKRDKVVVRRRAFGTIPFQSGAEFRAIFESKRGEMFSESVLQRIYDLVFREIEEDLRGAKNLYIVPHGLLHLLPLHAAMRPSGSPIYLEQRVAYLPSVSLLPRLIGPAPFSRGLGLINPHRGTADTLPFSELERLELEANSSTDFDVMAAEHATAQALHRWAEFDHIHFSCHAIAESDQGLASRLILSQGALLAHDILHRTSPLRKGGTVLLSACETAANDLRAVDASLSLSSVFLARGASVCCATQWRIDDLAGSLFSTMFVRARRGNLHVATAFEKAVKAVRNCTWDEALQLAQRSAKISHAFGDRFGASRSHRACQTIATQLRDSDTAQYHESMAEKLLHGPQLPPVVDDAPSLRATSPPANGPFAEPRHWASFRLIGRLDSMP